MEAIGILPHEAQVSVAAAARDLGRTPGISQNGLIVVEGRLLPRAISRLRFLNYTYDMPPNS